MTRKSIPSSAGTSSGTGAERDPPPLVVRRARSRALSLGGASLRVAVDVTSAG
jgi:hypothetical protein